MKRAAALTALLVVCVLVFLQRGPSKPAKAPGPGPVSGAADGTVQLPANEAPERVEPGVAGPGVAPVRSSSSELDEEVSGVLSISLSLQHWPEGLFLTGDGLADLRFADGTNAQARIERGQLEFKFASQPVGPVAVCRIQCGGEDYVYPPYVLCEVTPGGFTGGVSRAGRLFVWRGRALPVAVVGADPDLTYRISAPGIRGMSLPKKFKKLAPLSSPLALPVDPANPLDFILECAEGVALVAAEQAMADPCAPPLGVFFSRGGSLTLSLSKDAGVPEGREIQVQGSAVGRDKVRFATRLSSLEWEPLPSGLESSEVTEISLQPGPYSLRLEGLEPPLDEFEMEAGLETVREVRIESRDLHEGELELVLLLQEDYEVLAAELGGALSLWIERQDAPTKASGFSSWGSADWPPSGPNAQQMARILSGDSGWGSADWPPNPNAPGTARIPFGEIPLGKYKVSAPGIGFVAEFEHVADGVPDYLDVPSITRLLVRSRLEEESSVDLDRINLVRITPPLGNVQSFLFNFADAKEDELRFLACEGSYALRARDVVGDPVPGVIEVAGDAQEVILESAGLGTLSIEAAEGGEYARMTSSRIVESVLVDPGGQEVTHDRRAMMSVRFSDVTFGKLRYGPLELGRYELRLTYLSLDGLPIAMTISVVVPAGDTKLSMDLDRGELIPVE